MKTTVRHLLCPLSGAILALSGCARHAEPVEIHRLDQSLADGRIEAADTPVVDILFQISSYGPLTDSLLTDYVSKGSITAHRAAVDSAFASVDAESQALGDLFSRLGEILPGFRAPRVYAIISPFYQSVVTADTILYLGLNHYLGEGYAAYDYFPDWMRRRKVRSRIPADVAVAAVTSQFHYQPGTPSPSLLSRMIYEGAVTQAVMKGANVSEAEALGYDKEEMAALERDEQAMWRSLLDRRLLYSTDATVIRSAMTLSPASTVFSPTMPGGAGRWIGSRIVASYLKRHSEVGLDSLLRVPSEKAPEILKESGY